MQSASPAVSGETKAIATAKRLIQAINNIGIRMDPRVFVIRNMKPEEMKFKLDVLGIPYQELKLKNSILVPKEHLVQCYEIEKENKTRGNFLQEFNTKELEKIVSMHPAIPDKNILVIKNMNPIESDLFLKKCNRIKKGMLLETQKTRDGMCNISIPDGMLSTQEKEKVLLAYAETEIGVTGVNSPAKIRGEAEPSKEDYYNAVKEHRFINTLCHAVSEKIKASGHTLNSFGDYFKSFKLQLSHTAEQLENGADITGFNDNAKSAMLQTFQALPEGTYNYTSSYINGQSVTSKPAMAETMEVNRETAPAQTREVQ